MFTRASSLACILGATLVSTATAQSTAFTYQGRLKNAGQVAAGPYDFRFTLFNAAVGGVVVAPPQCVENLAVTEGLFTTTIDFGQVFVTTAELFIQIEARADTGLNCSDATGLVVLSPRQPVTAAPLATHAKTALSLAAADGSPANAVVVDNAGNVGIGTAAPTHTVHIASPAPTLALQDTDSTTNQVGYVSYRDSGNAELAWVGYGSAGSPVFSIVNARPLGHISLLPFAGGNVGIGTTAPAATLDVRGSIRLGSAGEFFAVKSSQNDRILRGYVNANGTINASQSGAGFTITHDGTGVYTINFSQAFASPPTVVLGATAQCCKPRLNGSQTTLAFVHVNSVESPYTLTDSPFTFVAIGQ